MRIILAAFIMACFTYQSSAQTLQSAISVDTRAGYTSNTILTPFVGAWDTTGTGSYTLIAPSAQANILLNHGTISGFGGIIYQPFLNRNTSWKGLYGILQYQHNFSYTWQAGISAGAKSVASDYTQNLDWIQSYVNWNLNPFLQLQLHIGHSYRSYINSANAPDFHEHYTTYGTGLDYWFTSQWRLSVSANGDLIHPFQPKKNFNASLRVSKYWKDASRLGLYTNWGQFENAALSQSTTGGTTVPNLSAPADNIESQIVQFGITGELPVNDQFSLTGRLSGLYRTSSNLNGPQKNIQGSVGLRFSFYPKAVGARNRAYPQWNENGNDVDFQVRYRGKGHLFIVGDFNDWSKPGIQLEHKSGSIYSTKLHLKPGIYEYKILKIDHNQTQWVKLSKSAPKTNDGYGGINGRFIVSGLQQ